MKSIIFYLFIITMLSCQKQQQDVLINNNIDDSNLFNALKNKYNLSSINIAPSTNQLVAITKTLKSTRKYINIFSAININSLRIYENKKENITIAMFYFKNNIEKLFSIKGYFLDNEFIITNDFLFERILKDKQNGQIIITNNDNATLIKLVNGKQIFSTIIRDSIKFKTQLITDCEGNHGGTGFCQRQSGEKFGDCYRAEKDEFCDSFIACLAAETQPQVMLMIAASCGCSAKACEVK
jgi:hypothetical protein